MAAEAAGVVVVGAARADAIAEHSALDETEKTMRPLWRESGLGRSLGWQIAILCACVLVSPLRVAAQSTPAASKTPQVKTFDTPEAAAAALVAAAESYDVSALEAIFGADGTQIIHTGEPARDKQLAADFAAKAHEKQVLSIDPKTPDRAVLVVGAEDWPFPVPIVKRGGTWHFDSKAGLREILYRRIGANELDAIQICHGYVEAQDEYVVMKRSDGSVNQYAQRIISSPGKKDGLAWQNPDGTWGGPIGEDIARIIEQGYDSKATPYHGYFFKILKGQGPAAPMGRMDYILKGAMIGGFALVAAPAEYRVTGVKTFIVSNDGVVYEKDLGPDTLEQFKKMELFNPDKTWKPVLEEPTT